jgi:hypothetical protein
VEIVLLCKENENDWNDFCFKSGDAWFWHTTHWMNYVASYKPEYHPAQASFLVTENKRIIALCPLMLETHDDRKEFSFSAFAVPSPALADEMGNRQRKKALDFIFEYIDSRAKDLGIQKVSFRSSPLARDCSGAKSNPMNYLRRYGYLDAAFNTQLLDISPDPGHLKSDVRKGHKYDINRASKLMDARVYDAATIDRATFDCYCMLHHKDAGGITRPPVTFDMMFDWIKKGHAILVGVMLKGKDQFVGFSYHILYKSGAYYASACSDPDCGSMPIAHFILWESIRWLHDNGFRSFEIGWQFYGSEFHYQTSPKEHQISKFKRGFGGDQVSQAVGEKYYDPDLFEKAYMKKIAHYRESIKGRRDPDRHER